MAAPRRLSDAAYNAAKRALLYRWANAQQVNNYRRLLRELDTHDAPLAPLGEFWRKFKSIKGYLPAVGQKTGQMLAEIGNPRNIKIMGDTTESSIYANLDPAIQARIDIFQSGFARPIKSPAEQRKLEGMASDAGILPAGKRFPIGSGPFGVAVMLYSPPRPFIKRDLEVDSKFVKHLTQMVLTGRRWNGVF